MKKQIGITLLALIITIIILLLLAGVALSAITGENNMFKNAMNTVEQYNQEQIKETIEMSIIEKQLEENREVSLDEIIDKLIEKGITTENNSDREIGTVVTEEGYLVTIQEKEEGGWKVTIGDKGTAKIKLNITTTPEMLTSKVTIKLEGQLIGAGLKELNMPDGSKREYKTGITRIEEIYEVMQNGTYKFKLIGNDRQEIEKEVIVNNIVQGIIAINPSTSKWTKENIKIEVIYPEGTEELIREISKDNGKTWHNYIEPIEISENTIVKARLRNKEETIKTATLSITNIDKTNPTVTATSGTETIEEGTSNNISSYFTYLANGLAEITSVTYTDTSNENEIVTNTNTLAVGTHIIKCTVTKETGAVAEATKIIIIESAGINAEEIANNPSIYYGKEITNYTTPKGDPNVKWKIFHADESNIYLIASDYIGYNYCPPSSNYNIYKNSEYKLSMDNVYKDYKGAEDIKDSRIKKWIQKYLDVAPYSTNINMRAVAYVLDYNLWNSYYKNSEYADYAIGAAPVEMFVKSYNKTHPEKQIYCKASTTGYYISWTEGGTSTSISGLNTKESLYVINTASKANAMYLASPIAYGVKYIMGVRYDGLIDQYGYNNGIAGFRPIICLNSNIKLEESNGNYIIITE